MSTFFKKTSRQVIFIKLGGSVITYKDTSSQANLVVLEQLTTEFHRAHQRSDALFIIGHGAGSFGHPQAHKYQTQEGIQNPKSLIGASLVRQAVSDLNGLVLDSLINKDQPVFTLQPGTFITTDNKKIATVNVEPIKNLLNSGMIPLIHGDIITDKTIGFTIYSGEAVLNIIAEHLIGTEFNPTVIIEVGKTNGVYDQYQQTIPIIDRSNLMAVQEVLAGSESTDVTGGMVHKVQQASQLAQKGIPTLLISAASGNLTKAILGQEVTGTWLKK